MLKQRYLMVIAVLFSLLAHAFPSFSKSTAVYIPSKNFKGADSVLVFMPDVQPNPSKKTPIIYTLSGYGSSHRSSLKYMNYDSLSNVHGVMIVTVSGGKDSWYMNDLTKPMRMYEDYFFKDLIPTVEKAFSMADTNKRIITGVSMGGHGAITFFAKHPTRFFACGSTSGVLDLSYSKVRDESIAKILGKYPEHKDRFLAASAVGMINNLKGINKPIYIDCGSEDYLFPANEQFIESCKKLKIQVTWVTAPGKHDKSYWLNAIPKQIDYFAKIMSK